MDYPEADEVIAALLKCGHDYTAKRDEIATLFYDSLNNGDYDATTNFDDGVRNLRLIESGEYDQSMDDEEKPEFSSQLCYATGHYIFFAE